MSNRKIITIVALAAIIVSGVAITPAALANGHSVAVETTSPEAQLANAIFRILGIPVSIHEVTTYRSRNIGNGEIALAYNLANASGRSVDDILDMRFEHHMGWGKIAKTLGVKLRGHADNSIQILRHAGFDTEADDFDVSIRVDVDEDDDRHEDGRNNHGRGHGKDR